MEILKEATTDVVRKNFDSLPDEIKTLMREGKWTEAWINSKNTKENGANLCNIYFRDVQIGRELKSGFLLVKDKNQAGNAGRSTTVHRGRDLVNGVDLNEKKRFTLIDDQSQASIFDIDTAREIRTDWEQQNPNKKNNIQFRDVNDSGKRAIDSQMVVLSCYLDGVKTDGIEKQTNYIDSGDIFNSGNSTPLYEYIKNQINKVGLTDNPHLAFLDKYKNINGNIEPFKDDVDNLRIVNNIMSSEGSLREFRRLPNAGKDDKWYVFFNKTLYDANFEYPNDKAEMLINYSKAWDGGGFKDLEIPSKNVAKIILYQGNSIDDFLKNPNTDPNDVIVRNEEDYKQTYERLKLEAGEGNTVILTIYDKSSRQLNRKRLPLNKSYAYKFSEGNQIDFLNRNNETLGYDDVKDPNNEIITNGDNNRIKFLKTGKYEFKVDTSEYIYISLSEEEASQPEEQPKQEEQPKPEEQNPQNDQSQQDQNQEETKPEVQNTSDNFEVAFKDYLNRSGDKKIPLPDSAINGIMNSVKELINTKGEGAKTEIATIMSRLTGKNYNVPANEVALYNKLASALNK